MIVSLLCFLLWTTPVVHSFGQNGEKWSTLMRPPAPTPESVESSLGRRNALQTLSTLVSLPFVVPTAAISAEEPRKPSIVPSQEVLRRLRQVPTFALVDGNGVPFMTYNSENAGGNGYFFIAYDNAQAVLEDARQSFENAKKAGTEGISDSWGDSKIVTVPLDYAMQLSVKKTYSKAQNDKSFRTFHQVLPSADDLAVAMKLDNGQRYRQRGRVPLFFVDGLELSPSDDGSPQLPVFFSPTDLRAEWKRQHPDERTPKVQVRELTETFRAMLKPGGTDESIKNLVFVPSAESVKVAEELKKSQTAGQVYKLDEIILTK